MNLKNTLIFVQFIIKKDVLIKKNIQNTVYLIKKYVFECLVLSNRKT